MRLPGPLPPTFFARGAASVARDLLGRLIVSTIGGETCIVRIVETEAYTGPRDAASHAAGWHRSTRNESMYGPPGRAYVYFTYGMHWCFNVVTSREGFPSAVLVRAGEPLAGTAAMSRRRNGSAGPLLTAGPARLAAALGIEAALDSHQLDHQPLWIAEGAALSSARVRLTPRIGISRAAGRRLRFVEKGNPFVSIP